MLCCAGGAMIIYPEGAAQLRAGYGMTSTHEALMWSGVHRC